MSLAALSPAGGQIRIDLRHRGGNGRVVEEVLSLSLPFELVRSISRIGAGGASISWREFGSPSALETLGLGFSESLHLVS